MIYRELVTRLSFAFDRTNLNKFEQAISGFKTRFNIAQLAVSGLIGKVINFASNLSNAVVYSKDIANYSGISLENFKAMQSAAQKFGIEESSFADFFGGLSTALLNASQGVDNFLFELDKVTGGRITFKKLNGEFKTTTQFVKDLKEQIDKIPTIQNKLVFLEQFPGIGREQSGNFLRFLESDIEKLTAIELDDARSFAQSEKEAVAFKDALNGLNVEFQKLSDSLSKYLLPVLTDVFNGFSAIIQEGKKFGGGPLGLIKSAGNATIEAAKHAGKATVELIGGDLFDYISSSIGNFFTPDFGTKALYEREQARNQSANITTNISINVPPGTTTQQADFMSDNLKNALDIMWGEKTREIFNNNPQVE